MKSLRLLLIVPIASASLLAGSVLTGNTNAGKTATYYACADSDTGTLRLVQPEEPCAEGEERLVTEIRAIACKTDPHQHA